MSKRFLISAALLICAFALPAISAAQDDSKDNVDWGAYDSLMEFKLKDVSDLSARFNEQQYAWMDIAPPGNDGWWQEGYPTPIPVDFGSLPKEFVSGLAAVDGGNCKLYPVWISEDPATREYVFKNVWGETIHTVPPPSGYDWQANVIAYYGYIFNGMTDELEIECYLAWLNPSRLTLLFYLVAADDLLAYCALPEEQKPEEDKDEDSKGGTDMMKMDWTGGSVEHLIISAVSVYSNANHLTIVYPDDYTNRLEIFGCTNLLDQWWTSLATTNISTSTNWIDWADSSVTNPANPKSFYIVGNGDYDSDGDSIPNAQEILVYHTDPDVSNSYPIDISGSISYTGQQDGIIWILAVNESNSWYFGRSTSIANPGAYTNTGLPNLTNYWFKSFRDDDGNGACDAWEAYGCYTSTAICVTNSITNINIALTDPDLDADGLPDWWEYRYFGSVAWGAGDDNDGDGLTNIHEYQSGTNPTMLDTDGDGVKDADDANPGSSNDSDSDGLPDDWETHFFGDLDESGSGDYDLDSLTNLQEYQAGTDPTKANQDDSGNAGNLKVYAPLEE